MFLRSMLFLLLGLVWSLHLAAVANDDEVIPTTLGDCKAGERGLIVYALTGCCPEYGEGYHVDITSPDPSSLTIERNGDPFRVCVLPKSDDVAFNVILQKTDDNFLFQSVAVGTLPQTGGLDVPFAYIQSRSDDQPGTPGQGPELPSTLPIASVSFDSTYTTKLTGDSTAKDVLYGKPHETLFVTYCAENCFL